MKEKGIKLLFSIFLFASVLMPFSVSAETITSSNIVGVERTLTNMELVIHDNSNFDKYNFIYNFEVLLDKSYIGWINISVGTEFTYSTKNGNQYINNTGSFTTPSRTYYVNGNSFNISSSVEINLTPGLTNSDIDPAKAYNPTFTLNSSNVVEMASIQSLDTVIDILNEINRNVDYTVWNFPLESYTFVNRFFQNGNDLVDIVNGNGYSYPMFNLENNSTLLRSPWSSGSSSDDMYIIFGVNKSIYDNTSLSNNFTLQNITIKEITPIYRDNQFQFTFLKVKFNIADSSNHYAYFIPKSNLNFIPIFFDYVSNSNHITTDFAMIYGLNNQLTNDVHIIAQGSSQSNSAASGLESETNQMQSDFNSYYSIENSANSDLNSALNGINFNDQIAGNQSFLDSASFVKTVFSSMMQIPILSTFVIILCIILMARIFL